MNRFVIARFERPSSSGRNAFNEPTGARTMLGKAYVAKRDLSATEKVSAGAETSARVTVFTVRENALTRDVRADDVLVVRGKDWNITGVTEHPGQRRGYLEFTAVSNRDG